MEIEKLFVTYKVGFNLKKVKFDEQCIAMFLNGNNIVKEIVIDFDEHEPDRFRNSVIKGYYNYANKHCSAPTWQQAIEWLESKHFTIDSYRNDCRSPKAYSLKWHDGVAHQEMFLKDIESAVVSAIKLMEILKKF